MNKPTHISEEALKKILSGELSKGEQAEWERFFDENPFEKEALEGLQMLSAEELEQDLKEIRGKISLRANTNIFSYRAIAASIAILLTSIALAMYFIKFPDTNLDMGGAESSTKKEIQMQEKEMLPLQKDESKIPDQNNLKNKEENYATKNDEIFPENKKIATRESEKSPQLQYFLDEKQTNGDISESKYEETEELKEVVSNEDKDRNKEEKKLTELQIQDKTIENNRKESGAVAQTEKPQLSPAYTEKKDKKQKTKKNAASAPQENRALNITKEEAYQSTNIVLQGKVLDAQTQKELKSVKIYLKGYSQSTQTDSLGNFSLSVPTLTKYILILETPAYPTLEVEASPQQKNVFSLKNKGK